MMDITFNGTAPLRLSVHKGYKVQLEISAEGGSITTVMTIEEALMLSDVLRRMAEEIQS